MPRKPSLITALSSYVKMIKDRLLYYFNRYHVLCYVVVSTSCNDLRKIWKVCCPEFIISYFLNENRVHKAWNFSSYCLVYFS